MDLREETISLVSAIRDADIPYALCGGLAVAIHGFPRATEDIDLLAREEDLDRIQATAATLGFTIPAAPIPLGFGKPFRTEIRRRSKAVDQLLIPLDIMLVVPELEHVWTARQSLHVWGIDVHVVSRDGLRFLKEYAGRPKDLQDLAELDERFDHGSL